MGDRIFALNRRTWNGEVVVGIKTNIGVRHGAD